MARVTIQVLEGLERGQVFADLPTPVSIGREDDNAVQLNDERVSRFHAKIQEDGGRIILTDLDSTNGTRVNGHPVQLRVLQPGDLVAIGRCLLVYGKPEDIPPSARAYREGRSGRGGENPTIMASDRGGDPGSSEIDVGLSPIPEQELDHDIAELFPHGPPDPPADLRPIQQAQVSDMLAYLHDRIRSVLQGARQNEQAEDRPFVVDKDVWQRLLTLEMELAVYLRRIADPDA